MDEAYTKRRAGMFATGLALLLAALASVPKARAAVPTSQPAVPLRLEPFDGLPEFTAATSGGPAKVSAGTAGVAPSTAVALRPGAGATLAILGDLAPDGGSDKYLQQTVAELNLLRPDMVLTTGNLVPGPTRDGRRYADDALRVRHALDSIKTPWYSTPGATDLTSGVRPDGLPSPDTRFIALYEKYFGPLYYSVNAGDIHAIVLDSEEGDSKIGDAQLRWLKDDLNRTFEGKGLAARPQWVIVVLHRPLWRESAMSQLGTDPKGRPGNWQQVHDLLVEFNRRPIVNLEGMGGPGEPGTPPPTAPTPTPPGAPARGPRVAAVIAGGERAYSQEPVLDGIRYYVLGPTGAMPRLGEDAGETLRQIMLLKFDSAEQVPAAGMGMHPSLLQIGARGGPADAPPIVPDDLITARDRATIDAIAAWDNNAIGVQGMIDTNGEPVGNKLRLVLNNPLPDDIDLQFRLASTRYLQPAVRREVSNTGAEGFDLPWELDSPHMIRHLAPGTKDGWDFAVDRPEKYEVGTESAPPQLEVAVHWNDDRGRVHEIILKRRITVMPRLDLPVSSAALRGDDDTWSKGASGNMYAWTLRGDEPHALNPTWQLAADDQRLYARVRVEDPIHSYWPIMALDPKLGGIASDAVSFAWAKGTPGNERVQRIWVMPFAPRPTAAIPPTRGPNGIIEGLSIAPVEMWTNTGTADRQTELQRLDPGLDVLANVTADNGGYVVTLSLPRKLIQQDPGITPAVGPAPGTLAASQPGRPVLGSAILNIAVHDNNEGPRTWTRSWANEDAGPVGWAHVQFLGPPPPPATAPQAGFPGIPGLPSLPFHFP